MNVGHGDCTIIEHSNGNLTVIDINNAKDLDITTQQELSLFSQFSFPTNQNKYEINRQRYTYYDSVTAVRGYDIQLTNPIEFLQNNYSNKNIFRYIQTHPDLDHMRGLSALSKTGIEIINFWDHRHNKKPDFNSDSDQENWEEYERLRNGKSNAKVLYLFRGDEGNYWTDDKLEILSPTPNLVKEANNKKNWNEMSYVFRLTYQGYNIIFGGDAEKDAWDEMVNFYGDNLKCDILKASHHGRDSGYHQQAVKLMKPQYTIVSVGKKPETDASNKYRQYSDHVWSTRWRGNITLEIDTNGQANIDSEYDR